MNKKILSFVCILIFILTACTKKSNVDANIDPIAANLEARLSIDSANSRFVTPIQDILFDIEGSVLKGRDIKGTITMSYEFTKNIINIEPCGKNILVFFEDNVVHCYNSVGLLLWTTSISSGYIDVYTDNYGVALFEYRTESLGSFARIILPDGTTLKDITLTNSYITDFYSKGNEYYISIMDLSAETVHSKVLLYNNDGEMKWANNINHQLVLFIEEWSKGQVLAITQENVYLLKSEKEAKSVVETGGTILNIATTKGQVTLVVSKKGEHYLQVYSSDFSLKSEVQISAVPSILLTSSTYNILAKDNALNIYDLEGHKTHTYNTMSDIKSIEFQSDNSLIVNTSISMEKIRFK